MYLGIEVLVKPNFYSIEGDVVTTSVREEESFDGRDILHDNLVEVGLPEDFTSVNEVNNHDKVNCDVLV